MTAYCIFLFFRNPLIFFSFFLPTSFLTHDNNSHSTNVAQKNNNPVYV